MADISGENDESSRLLGALKSLPLFDDPFLSMQAQNVAMVNAFIVELEDNMLKEYLEKESTPVAQALFTSAVSQMWIFSLYELLRTWRHRVKDLQRHQKQFLAGGKPTVIIPKDQVDIDKNYPYLCALSRAETDLNFIAEIQVANDKMAAVFESIDSLRVTLAKHVVPGVHNLMAANVGYARIDSLTGSLNYSYVDKEGFTNVLSRSVIVEALIKSVAQA